MPGITKVEKARREALEGEGSKYCSCCEAVKSLSEFRFKKNYRKGVSSECRSCANKNQCNQRELRRSTKQKESTRSVTKKELARRGALEDKTSKYCFNCKTVKSLTDFSPQKNTSKGVCARCKVCTNEYYCDKRELERTTSVMQNKAKRPTKKELARRDSLEGEGYKFCPRCEAIKPLSDFGVKPRERKGVGTWCKLCEANGRRERAHNMTLDECTILLKSQGDKCAICGTMIPAGRFGVFHIDHDHKIADSRLAVRGLLCTACNHGLGNFKDNPEALLAAAAYVLEAKERTEPLIDTILNK